MPTALEARPLERELQVAFVEAAVRIAVGRPGAAVPHDHGPAAVFALGNVALEIEVLHGMVFGAHGEPLVADRKARPARHRPALEHAVELEPQIVVGAARGMFLHHELQSRGLAALLRRLFRLRLGRAGKVAFADVVLERVLARPRWLRPITRVHDLSFAQDKWASRISQYLSERRARAAHSDVSSSAR